MQHLSLVSFSSSIVGRTRPIPRQCPRGGSSTHWQQDSNICAVLPLSSLCYCGLDCLASSPARFGRCCRWSRVLMVPLATDCCWDHLAWVHYQARRFFLSSGEGC